MGFIADIFGGGDDAADAAMQAASTSAEAQEGAARIAAKSQEEALGYLKEINLIPQGFKEEALKRLGGLYGLEGGLGSQEDLIQKSIESPLYQRIMGGLDVGEEAILRNAAATGGLRSGNTQYNLADYSTQLQNKALLESYNQQLMGLKGLAGLSTGESGIADLISQIGLTQATGVSGAGKTTAQGITAAAQAEQAGTQNMWNNLLGLGSLGVGIAGMFSDRRLKKNIKVLGKIKGFNWCSFEWNSIAKKLGLEGKTCGIMADEVFEKVPEAVILKDGFMFVLYDLLGFSPNMEGVTQ